MVHFLKTNKLNIKIEKEPTFIGFVAQT